MLQKTYFTSHCSPMVLKPWAGHAGFRNRDIQPEMAGFLPLGELPTRDGRRRTGRLDGFERQTCYDPAMIAWNIPKGFVASSRINLSWKLYVECVPGDNLINLLRLLLPLPSFLPLLQLSFRYYPPSMHWRGEKLFLSRAITHTL